MVSSSKLMPVIIIVLIGLLIACWWQKNDSKQTDVVPTKTNNSASERDNMALSGETSKSSDE